VKRFLIVFAISAATSGLMYSFSRSQDPDKPQAFMRAKLDHSQKLLEGLVMEDFNAINRNAQALSLLSLAASWQVMQTPEYAQQSLEFRRAADAVHQAAEKKNIDAAALAYMDVTIKCVNCHKYVRGVRMAAAEGLVSPGSALAD
jgi:hypothetical protein